MSHGYVYLILSSNGLYKIGKTRNLKQRLAALRSETTEMLTVIQAIETFDQAGEESLLHDIFSRQRVTGEWFALKDSHLARFALTAKHIAIRTELERPYHDEAPQ